MTITAGAVWIVAVLGAFLALTRARFAMAIVALSSLAFAVIIGAPLVRDLLITPDTSKLQLGQYLTIPGVAAIALLLAILVLPFVVGFVWAGRRVFRRG